MNVLKTAARLIQAESPSGGEAPAARVLMEEARALGFAPELDDAGNVEFVLGESGAEVLLTGHMDAVPAGDEAEWPHPPFAGRVVDGELWGRGAVDMKGALAAMLGAMAKLAADPPPGRVRFLAVVQEEVGGLGSRFAAQRLGSDVAILGEPSRNRLMRGHRGRLEVWADYEGRLAHAARPELGHNPLPELGRFLAALEAFETAEHPELGPASCTPTFVGSRPEATNVVPGLAQVCVDYRFVPGEDPDAILERMRLIAGDASVYVPEILRSSGEVEMRYPMVFPPHLVPADHPLLIAALAELGQEEAGVWWFTTDAPYLAASGAVVLGLGPGDPELAHTTQERVVVRELEEAAALYARLARRLLEVLHGRA
ncbi:M20 family metallopeptidase [Oceanithermus sp.]